MRSMQWPVEWPALRRLRELKVRMTPQMTGANAGNSSVNTTDRSVEESLNQRWLYLLPAVFITYSLAYLDRANYGFGAAAGLAATLRITEKDSAILAGLFFLGYFAFQIPGRLSQEDIVSAVSSSLLSWRGERSRPLPALFVNSGCWRLIDPAGRGRESDFSGHASFAHALVHPRRTCTGQRYSFAGESDHGALDVSDYGIPDRALRLAEDFHL